MKKSNKKSLNAFASSNGLEDQNSVLSLLVKGTIGGDGGDNGGGGIPPVGGGGNN